MWANFVSFALIGLGISLCVQGFLAMRGRLRLRGNFLERPLVALWEGKHQSLVPQILGRMRLIYGIFFVVVGVWSLF